MNNTLLIFGGLNTWTNNSGASPCMSISISFNLTRNFLIRRLAKALNSTKIELSNAFSIPQSFTAVSQPQDSGIPMISNGTLWTNRIDKIWLFGGKSSKQTDHENSLWRFDSTLNGQQWVRLDSTSTNLTGPWPADGAGCNVLSRKKGYYLGGISKNENSSSITYLHSITIF